MHRRIGRYRRSKQEISYIFNRGTRHLLHIYFRLQTAHHLDKRN